MKESYWSYVKRWNYWRKRNKNSKLYQFLVLIKVYRSLTMELMIPIELPKRKASRY